MTGILEGLSLFPLLLTLGAYELGLLLQKKLKSPLCNPILIASALVIGVLLLLDFPAAEYQSGLNGISWLLTPATVCLAIPMYENLKILKKNLPGILAGVAAGTAASLGIVALLGVLFRLDPALLASLLPKSITTALGMALSEQMGGMVSVTTAVILITGILGSVLGSSLCKLFRIRGEIAQGVAFGTASHVIGTSRASQLSELTGAVSSLSLVVAGILTALLCPLVLSLLS